MNWKLPVNTQQTGKEISNQEQKKKNTSQINKKWEKHQKQTLTDGNSGEYVCLNGMHQAENKQNYTT